MANILIHSLVFAPDGVSTAYLYSDLAIGLKKLGHSVTVLTTTPHFNVLSESLKTQPLVAKRGKWLYFSKYEGIPVWHIAMPEKSKHISTRLRHMLFFHFKAMLFSLIHQDRFDIIISPSPPLTIGAVSWLMAIRYGAKPVYNVQELYPDLAINQGAVRNPVVIWCLKKLEKLVYNRSDRIISIGEMFRKAIVSRGVSEHKVITIPNFVDTDLYRPLPRDNSFAREHDLVDSFVVMYAGNIGLAQCWEPFLVAAKNLSSIIRFVVIGNGVRRDWLAGEIKKRGLKNALMLEYQNRERMPEINASCDVSTILMDSKVAEDGFPSKIYTTMACEKPTVVYCPENSELVKVVRDSKCGRWVPDGNIHEYIDTLKHYNKNRNAVKLEGVAGRAYVEANYSRQVVIEQYHEMIQELIGS